MWLGAAPVLELFGEVDAATEVQGAIVVDVDIQRFEVGRSVDQSNVAGLEEVVCDNYMLLIWGDLDVVRANCRLIFIRIVKTLDIAQI